MAAAAEMDTDSNASSAEEVESPKSVVQKLKRRSVKVRVHSQVLRIRAEDSHLGKDIGEGNLSLKDKFGVTQFMVFSRPILPASPLSGRTSC
ncbi:hypothetical protein CDL12_11041 [Handroanthus impetiginosus]|uniref:Uncharacterized protein n=1 Tax=Handroanthus impetiginosus TaxID=429701 RepID=A0A2G9HFK3_9LAMI|nr:hypothetical protein CDL12_11041 [Handroanthus impetiginosus]